ncbi:hypothetical protein BDN72DRAFT_538172 [Pluteus cervinus]|uniref:Uncharacterized protein n=1 Tax=Pluteus cervinus TaxID=181527 RepID=A0ACD3AY06_9AGAR|nr:hypothetical protein BDN72DRAFT_538172 [Pluteus cervinus]
MCFSCQKALRLSSSKLRLFYPPYTHDKLELAFTSHGAHMLLGLVISNDHSLVITRPHTHAHPTNAFAFVLHPYRFCTSPLASVYSINIMIRARCLDRPEPSFPPASPSTIIGIYIYAMRVIDSHSSSGTYRVSSLLSGARSCSHSCGAPMSIRISHSVHSFLDFQFPHFKFLCIIALQKITHRYA